MPGKMSLCISQINLLGSSLCCQQANWSECSTAVLGPPEDSYENLIPNLSLLPFFRRLICKWMLTCTNKTDMQSPVCSCEARISWFINVLCFSCQCCESSPAFVRLFASEITKDRSNHRSSISELRAGKQLVRFVAVVTSCCSLHVVVFLHMLQL